MLGYKSYRTAAVTLSGIELVHRIRKRQFTFGPGRRGSWSLKQQCDRALAFSTVKVGDMQTWTVNASPNAPEPNRATVMPFHSGK